MTDFDFKKIERKAAEEAAKTKAIKDKSLEHIKKISKDIGKVKAEDFEVTEEQRNEIKKLEAKYGKIVIKKDRDNDKEKRIPTLTTYKYSKNGSV